MKIGIMSDTHLLQVSDWLKQVVEEHFHDVDMILHAGDIVSGQVLAYLESNGVEAVRGNMDYAEVSHLPAKKVFEIGDFKIGLMHGYGAPHGLPERLRPEFDKIDCLIFGHSHRTMNKTSGGVLFFNPGSAADPRSNRGRTVGVLHVNDRLRGEIINLD